MKEEIFVNSYPNKQFCILSYNEWLNISVIKGFGMTKEMLDKAYESQNGFIGRFWGTDCYVSKLIKEV